jgi:hypothetical protein
MKIKFSATKLIYYEENIFKKFSIGELKCTVSSIESKSF